MALQAPSSEVTFSRGELVELASISDGVAAFWMKNGLLRPTSGGEGRGNHRRFDRMQVTIAAILGELQRFGLNVRALSSFATILQSAVEHGQRINARTGMLYSVLNVARRLRRFRAGEEVQVYIVDKTDGFQPASNELEIAVGEAQMDSDYKNCPEELLRLADEVDPDQIEAIDIYANLREEMEADHPQEGSALLLWQVDDEWQFDLSSSLESRFRQAGDIPSGIYLALGAIVRRVWSISQEERQLNRDRQREEFFRSLPPLEKRRLAKAWGREVE